MRGIFSVENFAAQSICAKIPAVAELSLYSTITFFIYSIRKEFFADIFAAPVFSPKIVPCVFFEKR